MDYAKKIQWTNDNNSFMACNGIRLVEMTQDRALVELRVTPQSCNIYGNVHGGVLLTMADCAAGGAARSGGFRYVTQSSNLNFYRNTDNPLIRAEGRIRHRGRTVCVAEVEITDGTGALLASGNFSLFAIGPDPIGADDPPEESRAGQ